MPIEICICSRGRITGLTPNTPPSLLDSNFQAPGVPSFSYANDLEKDLSGDIALLSQVGILKSKPLAQRQSIAKINEVAGPDMLLALSDFYSEQLADLPSEFWASSGVATSAFLAKEHRGMLGASVGAMGSRLSALQSTIKNYQLALEAVRQAYQAKMPKLQRVKLEQRARAIHTRLNTEFADEIAKRLAKARVRKNSIWTSSDRGLNLAKSARSSAPIQIASANELRQLNRFAGAAKVAGNGLMLLDVHSRATKVRSTFENGGNWEKQALQETTGFAAGVAAGSIVGGAAYSIGVGIALAFTPVGWAVVIGVGLAAAAGFAAGYFADIKGKEYAGKAYDWSSATSWF